MYQPKAAHKRVNKIKAKPIRKSWLIKPIERVKPSKKVYNRKRDTFMDEKFRGL
jgi:hypothetical protein